MKFEAGDLVEFTGASERIETGECGVVLRSFPLHDAVRVDFPNGNVQTVLSFEIKHHTPDWIRAQQPVVATVDDPDQHILAGDTGVIVNRRWANGGHVVKMVHGNVILRAGQMRPEKAPAEEEVLTVGVYKVDDEVIRAAVNYSIAPIYPAPPKLVLEIDRSLSRLEEIADQFRSSRYDLDEDLAHLKYVLEYAMLRRKHQYVMLINNNEV